MPRHRDDVHALRGFDTGLGIREHVQLAATRADLLEVRLQLFQQVVVGRDGDDRHVRVHQRQRAVLQFARRIGLRVDVGDLLELERAFHRDREQRAATQEQRVLLVPESFGPVPDVAVERQRQFDQAGDLDQPADQLVLALARDAVVLGQRDDQHAERGQLGRERLGRGDADLRPRAGQHHQFRLADQGTLGRIADGKRRQIALLLRQAQGRQRVGGFAGLRDGDEQRVLEHDGLAVTELAGDVDPAWQPGDLLDEIAGHGAGMKARATGDDLHRFGAAQDVHRRRPEGGLEQLAAHRALRQRLRDGARLFMDLLQHVVRIVAPLDRVGRQFAVANRPVDRGAAGIDDIDALAMDGRHVALVEEHEAPGHRQQRRDVGGDEVLVLAQADDDGAAGARQHDGVRILLGNDRERVGAVQFAYGLLDRREQVAVAGQMQVDAVRDDLGVGLRAELVAAALEIGAKFLVVLDDAVVDDRHAVAGDVRMGVAFARHAVGRPARVRDADVAVRRALVERVAQPLHLADGAQTPHLLAAVQHRHAGRVVTAVLQALQALDQDRDDVPVSNRAYDAAHGDLPWSRSHGQRAARSRD